MEICELLECLTSELCSDFKCSLDGLPFPDEEFDFVRISFIGLGVPEDEVSS